MDDLNYYQTFIFFPKFKLGIVMATEHLDDLKTGRLHFWTQLPSYVNLNKTSSLASALAKPSTVFAKMLLIITYT